MSTLILNKTHKVSLKGFIIASLIVIAIATTASILSYPTYHACEDNQIEKVRETFVIPASYILTQTVSNREKCQYHDCWYIKVPGYDYCSKHLKKKMKRSR